MVIDKCAMAFRSLTWKNELHFYTSYIFLSTNTSFMENI